MANFIFFSLKYADFVLFKNKKIFCKISRPSIFWSQAREILPKKRTTHSLVGMYNTNGFRIESMYDYYIAMKSMFLVAKLFSHPSIIYASPTILLPWTKHKQHQNHSKSKAFQNQNFNSHKLCIHTIILYKWRCFSRSQTPTYILTKRKLIKKLLKIDPSHGSPNNQKETKSHGPSCDSIINHKETISHASPCDSTINHKGT